MSDIDARRIQLTFREEPLPDPLQLAVGDEVTLVLHGSPAHSWLPLTGADGPVVLVEEHTLDGTLRALVRATSPGVAELRSIASYAGARFGPGSGMWRLRVVVSEPTPRERG
ncbi:hypothetical protein ACFQZC_01495 [Streptacidiphilus monticola]